MRFQPITAYFLLLITVSCFSPKEKESFSAFFHKFSLDEKFQLERVKFPIEREYLGYPAATNGKPALDPELIKEEISQDAWKHAKFYYDGTRQFRPQFYDNFQRKLRDSDERVFAWQGIENGIQIYYYFKRIDGRWFLTKIEDLSM